MHSNNNSSRLNNNINNNYYQQKQSLIRYLDRVTTSKILISGIPMQTRFEDIEPLLKPYGIVKQCEAISSKDQNTQTVHITFENPEQAQRAAVGLNGVEFEGSKLHAEQLDKNQRRSQRNQRNPYPGMPGPGRQADFPLRILVQSEMVGAIIGRQGSTIRTITQQSRARVDVHRKENVGSLEKSITIYGNPENCTNACKRILEVMQQEAISTNKGELSPECSEICLKILAHNNLIGRIIGKSGNTIKRIMQDTDTKITVSSINDINSFNLERIITVKGLIENMSRAENQISTKLRQSYENDLQAMAPQSLMFPGLHPMAMMSTPGNGMVFNTSMPFPSCQSFAMSKTPASVVPPVFPNDLQETTYLYIPNNAVGAIIGTKGSHIRSIMRFSNASLKIAPLDADKPLDQQTERKVTIVGTPEGQWKAQYMIFEKMREEGFMCGTDDVRLTVELLVASSQVGRIIGKGGQNVRELQRVTGSVIKLPEHALAPPSGGDEETPVHIIGLFYSVQSAQRRIRAMMLSTNPPPITKKQKAAKEQLQQQQQSLAGAASSGSQQQQPQSPSQQQALPPQLHHQPVSSASSSSTPPAHHQQQASTAATSHQLQQQPSPPPPGNATAAAAQQQQQQLASSQQ
ncbi:insulin-like growth factor 2 mRNA-binding protein 1 isoform X3 [Drosophila sechellia]|uniref:insulin-like growth factor 2 mRNA-binding protein 1 isoform X3 n=1 Tax=Drosophila simulans TaxID=7240 RepID=UPI00078AEF10|nr:insulin-like growth factor 2 mRNA-binding protein 1 isoform X3 [Drosophila simulans]XP_016038825.1 insulin-like growth factor 2 mRNA-binding protein 1 isoform X3 [Drosophila simulans]XP_016038829.1 insulin-like growth factor 2 mRNA-binding protein 1 isoform X3 [Drosophila simulans]XP_016038833.1 insulin-like growth factor 2 mRNA-binding protein 1 isoform X3 [Drosophila simulans]XP_032582496.1 insulin-like growth factor 2 mRNA-binding protein 1 isoform X3 [Drosophila sechellia]XP_032582497.1